MTCSRKGLEEGLKWFKSLMRLGQERVLHTLLSYVTILQHVRMKGMNRLSMGKLLFRSAESDKPAVTH